MDFATLTNLSGDDLASALALDFSTLDDAALSAALDERRTEATRLFSLTEPTLAEVDVAEALVSSITGIEEQQAERTAQVTAAAERFAAARAQFSGAEEVDAAVEDADEAEDADAAEDAADDETEDADADAEDGEDGEGDADGG